MSKGAVCIAVNPDSHNRADNGNGLAGGQNGADDMPVERRPGKQKKAFLLCMTVAFLLTLLAAVGAVVCNMIRTELFRNAMNDALVAPGLVSMEDADAFARQTVDYLAGRQAIWEPDVTLNGRHVDVPEAFSAHMANVKRWVGYAGILLAGLAAIALLLLWRVMAGARSGKRGFSFWGYGLGALIPLGTLAGFGLWSSLDFQGMWAWLHRTFIPDGIFSAQEDIMRLFPLEVFASYLRPVAITFGACMAVVLLLPWLMKALCLPRAGKTESNPSMDV